MPSATEILRYLDSFRKRKAMYLGEIDINPARHFLTGFLVGCASCGFPVSWDRWRRAAEVRGWKTGGLHPVSEMEARGMSAEQIIDELITIHEVMLREVDQGEV